MKVEKSMRWISADDGNPAYGKISGVDYNPKDGVTLNITLENGEERKASIWGANLNKAIASCGDETSAWIGKKFACQFEMNESGKNRRLYTLS